MTQNQIAYHNAKETARHNLAYEEELRRHQLADEAIKARANAIQATANYVNAVHYRNMDSENQRSHMASEYLTQQSNLETSRHNQAVEALTSSLNASLIKKNVAEASYASANAGYIQERTKTQAEETRKMGYEADSAKIGVLLTDAQRVETLNRASAESARKTLLEQQALVQQSIGVKNYADAFYAASGTVKNLTGATGDVFKFLFGDEGTSLLQQQNMDTINSYGQQQTGLDAYLNGSVDVETFTGNSNYYN